MKLIFIFLVALFETTYTQHQQSVDGGGYDKKVCNSEILHKLCAKNYTQKWYYDRQNSGCRRFWWGGCLQKEEPQNKFDSEQECLKICVLPPTKSPTEINQQSTGSLDSSVCLENSDIGPCGNYVVRWYYDNTNQVCRQFYYGGCSGNKNNFQNVEDCQRTCVREGRQSPHSHSHYHHEGERHRGSEHSHVERVGPPHSGQNTAPRPLQHRDTNAPSNNRDNQQTLQHRESVGIQQRRLQQDVCSQKYETGPCRNFSIQWAFDSFNRICRQFHYGGCHVNDNRFGTEEDCKRTCLPNYSHQDGDDGDEFDEDGDEENEGDEDEGDDSEDEQTQEHLDYSHRQNYDQNQNLIGKRRSAHSSTSQQSYAVGEDESIKKRYVNIQSKHSKIRENAGDVTVNQLGRKLKKIDPAMCEEPLDLGSCGESHLRFFYSTEHGKCKAFKFRGCQRNNNHFLSRIDCERKCGKYRNQDVCKMAPDSGTCTFMIKMWYFDSASQTCSQFNFSGCNGNGNNFLDESECMEFCGNSNDSDQSSEIEHIKNLETPIELNENAKQQQHFNISPAVNYQEEAYVVENDETPILLN